MRITLVGMGSGAPGGLTVRGLAALQGAGLIIGARRLLQNLPDGCTDNRTALYKTDEICALLQEAGCEQTAVVFSGDTGFYSGAGALCRALDAAGTPYTVEPGVSSVQLLAAALGRPWQDWQLVSAHGCACDPVAACQKGVPTFFLTGGSETPATLCARLAAAGYGEVIATVGENLGSDAQRLVTDTAAALAQQQFAPLSVLLAERCPAPPRRTPGLPDEVFLRGKTPMTKQEVRAAVLAKLAVRPNDTLWDVGAGTGSVSVEMALAAPEGRVYAAECDADACELICRAKFAPYPRAGAGSPSRVACPGRCVHRREQGQSACHRGRRAGGQPCRAALHQRHCAGNFAAGRRRTDRPWPDCPGYADRRQPQQGGGRPASADGK